MLPLARSERSPRLARVEGRVAPAAAGLTPNPVGGIPESRRATRPSSLPRYRFERTLRPSLASGARCERGAGELTDTLWSRRPMGFQRQTGRFTRLVGNPGLAPGDSCSRGRRRAISPCSRFEFWCGREELHLHRDEFPPDPQSGASAVPPRPQMFQASRGRQPQSHRAAEKILLLCASATLRPSWSAKRLALSEAGIAGRVEGGCPLRESHSRLLCVGQGFSC